MVVLKKIKSASLVEVIVAAVLIVIIFIIASLVLNNLILNTYSKNTHPIENRLNELEYEIQNDLIKLPYQENYKGWDIEIKTVRTDSKVLLTLLAIDQKSNKEIIRERNYVEK